MTSSATPNTQRQAANADTDPSASILLALLDASPDIISFKDRNLRFVYSNAAHAGWFGVRRDQIPGRTVEQIIGSDTTLTENIRARDLEVLERGRTHRRMQMEESPSGIFVCLEILVFPVLDDAQSVIGVATIGRDVSSLMAREQALQESQELHELAIRGSQDGIWDFRVEGGNIGLSERAAGFLGLAADHLSLSPAELMARARPEDVEPYLKAYQQHLKSDDDYFLAKLRVPTEDNYDRWLSIRGASLRGEDGRVYRMAGSVSDISEQTRVERALRDGERRFIDFTRAAADWFWETDREHCFTYLSPNVKSVSGLDLTEYIGRPRFVLADLDPGDEAWVEHRRDLAARRAFRNFEYERTLPSGLWRRFRISGVPIFDEDGQFSGYRGTGLDVTEEALNRERAQAAESLLSEAIEVMADAAALFDADDRLVKANSAYLDRWCENLPIGHPENLTFEEIVRHNVLGGYLLKDGQDQEEFVTERLRKHFEPSSPFEVEFRDGNIFQFIENPTTAGGRFLVVRDITQLKNDQRALKASEARFRALYDDNPSMFFTLDEKGNMLSVNGHGASQLGYAPGHLNGKHVNVVHLPDDHDQMQTNIQSCFAAPTHTQRWEVRKLHRNGETFWVRESGRVVENPDGEMTLLTVCEDISEARRLSEELTYQATHDSLTGLVNRREFERRVHRILRTQRKERSQHALCYLDLDQFKVINDTSGHPAGDELLKRISQLMSSKVRRRDTVARLGGDEFGVLFEHCPPERAEALASELQEMIKEFRFYWNGKAFRIGASVGLVELTEEFEQLSDVLAAADQACYAAKESGGDRVQRFDSGDTKLLERRDEMHWFGRLNSALEDDRLRLAYQIIESSESEKQQGVHCEILVRLEEEDGELIHPGAFLPAAERYNLLTQIDKWVVSSTLEWLSREPDWRQRIELCSINLSGQSLGDERFTEQIVQLLERSDVPDSKLCFEITETVAISNLAAANRFISRLRKRGVKFALDDFGSGLSSFAYLRNLAVDYLKIDGVFVRDIIDDPIDRAMVRSINEIGHLLGKQTVAEFVENDAIATELRAIGVNYLQGYSISKPVLISKPS